MCTPYLDNLNARILQLHDAIRSARLNLLESLVEQKECEWRLAPGSNVEDKQKAEQKLNELRIRRSEETEPVLLSTARFTTLTMGLYEELHAVREQVQSWNGSTPAPRRKEYTKATEELQPQIMAVIRETKQLRDLTEQVGIPISKQKPRPDFDALALMEVMSARSQVRTPSAADEVEKYLNDYETNAEIQQKVAQEVEEVLAKAKAP